MKRLVRLDIVATFVLAMTSAISTGLTGHGSTAALAAASIVGCITLAAIMAAGRLADDELAGVLYPLAAGGAIVCTFVVLMTYVFDKRRVGFWQFDGPHLVVNLHVEPFWAAHAIGFLVLVLCAQRADGYAKTSHRTHLWIWLGVPLALALAWGAPYTSDLIDLLTT